MSSRTGERERGLFGGRLRRGIVCGACARGCSLICESSCESPAASRCAAGCTHRTERRTAQRRALAPLGRVHCLLQRRLHQQPALVVGEVEGQGGGRVRWSRRDRTREAHRHPARRNARRAAPARAVAASWAGSGPVRSLQTRGASIFFPLSFKRVYTPPKIFRCHRPSRVFGLFWATILAF